MMKTCGVSFAFIKQFYDHWSAAFAQSVFLWGKTNIADHPSALTFSYELVTHETELSANPSQSLQLFFREIWISQRSHIFPFSFLCLLLYLTFWYICGFEKQDHLRVSPSSNSRQISGQIKPSKSGQVCPDEPGCRYDQKQRLLCCDSTKLRCILTHGVWVHSACISL